MDEECEERLELLEELCDERELVECDATLDEEPELLERAGLELVERELLGRAEVRDGELLRAGGRRVAVDRERDRDGVELVRRIKPTSANILPSGYQPVPGQLLQKS